MDSQKITRACGAILAGGAARRLGGISKGLLLVGGEPIIERAGRVLGELFDEVLLSTNDPAVYAGTGLSRVPDRFSGKGAPGGLHAVLSASRAEWVFVVACDMPFLSPPLVRYLAGQRRDFEAVLVRFRGRLEPLHAFWSRSCLSTMERMLREGDPSLRDIASSVRHLVVEESEWSRQDPQGRAFSNVNTREDASRLGIEVPSPKSSDR